VAFCIAACAEGRELLETREAVMEGKRRGYSLEERFYQVLFALMSRVGRPFGGIRPRRLTHKVAFKAYGRRRPDPSEFAWHADRWGAWMLLHPYYALDYQLMAFGTYDEEVQRCIDARLKPGMVFFDVGANIGAVSLHGALLVGPSGQVHSFEPVPAIVDRLAANVSRNGLTDVIRIHTVALADTCGKAKISFADKEANNQGMASLVTISEGFLQEEVETITLDEFVRRQGINHIDLMKIDIQGAEPLLIKGAKEVFGSPDAPDLIMEFQPGQLVTLKDLAAMIEECGYEIYKIEKTGRLGKRLVAAEINPDEFCNAFCTKNRAPNKKSDPAHNSRAGASPAADTQ
jgi:FkbM family methyltransferase